MSVEENTALIHRLYEEINKGTIYFFFSLSFFAKESYGGKK